MIKLANVSICSGIRCLYKFMTVAGNCFQLDKVSTVPCMFSATPSLGQRVDD